MMFANFKGIYDHDVVIWMGDLNYRLSASLSSEEIINACTMGQHGNLFQFDQVRSSIEYSVSVFSYENSKRRDWLSRDLWRPRRLSNLLTSSTSVQAIGTRGCSIRFTFLLT